MSSSGMAGLALALMLGIALAGCEEEEDKPKPVKVTGTSGDQVSLDGTWTYPCGNSGSSNAAVEIDEISGTNVSVTRTEYIGAGGASPDCSGEEDLLFTLEVDVSRDVAEVALSGWVDDTGTASTAPAGLDSVTEGNGLSFTITEAGMTTLTQTAVDLMNAVAKCGHTDWGVGTTYEGAGILECFLEGGSGDLTATWVLDDTTSDTEHYVYASDDASTAVDANGFVTEVENFSPGVR